MERDHAPHDTTPDLPSRNRVYAGFGHLIKGIEAPIADFDWDKRVPTRDLPLARGDGRGTRLQQVRYLHKIVSARAGRRQIDLWRAM